MLYCQTNPAEIISRIFDRSERHPALQRLGDVQNSGRYPEAGVSEPSTPVDAKTCEKLYEPWSILTIWLMVIPSIMRILIMVIINPYLMFPALVLCTVPPALLVTRPGKHAMRLGPLTASDPVIHICWGSHCQEEQVEALALPRPI